MPIRYQFRPHNTVPTLLETIYNSSLDKLQSRALAGFCDRRVIWNTSGLPPANCHPSLLFDCSKRRVEAVASCREIFSLDEGGKDGILWSGGCARTFIPEKVCTPYLRAYRHGTSCTCTKLPCSQQLSVLLQKVLQALNRSCNIVANWADGSCCGE